MKCSYCNKEYKTETRYNKHLDTCNNKIEFKCFICSTILSTKFSYNRHLDYCKKNNEKLKDNILSKKLETDYEQKIIELQNRIKTLELESSLKLKETEVNYEKKLNRIIGLGKNTSNTNNFKNVNVTINNNSQRGISNKQLLEEMNEYRSNNPFFVNENTFHKLITDLNVVVNNITLHDVSRGITSFYDLDENRQVKDVHMKNLSAKAILSIDHEFTNKISNFNNLVEIDQYDKDKGKIFIDNIIVHKNTENPLVKTISDKSYLKLKDKIPNRVKLELLHESINNIIELKLIESFFYSVEDFGFFIGSNLDFQGDKVIIKNYGYRFSDVCDIVKEIMQENIKSCYRSIDYLIKSNHLKNFIYGTKKEAIEIFETNEKWYENQDSESFIRGLTNGRDLK